MKEYSLTIEGKSVTTENTFAVINPATEEVLARAPDCSIEQLNLAVDAANQALRSWSEDETTRRQALKECAAAIRSHSDEFAELFTLEQGRTLQDTKAEVLHSAWWIDEVAQMKVPIDLLVDDETSRVEIRRKPLGVVGAITPWNFPIILAVSKWAPALLIGNTVVLKPSPFTPLTTLKIGELLRDVLPPGVLNVLSGGDKLGAWMTNHPGIRMITFTGSVATGKVVAQAAAKSLKRVVLELGGNDAAIVLPDVDPKKVAEKIFPMAFRQCGQVCIAIKRLYIHENMFAEMVDELQNIAEKVVLGDGLDPETDMGPMNNLPQLERVIELTENARRNNAEIVTGGERIDRPGYFFPPTIVTNISEGLPLVDEEQFGPVLPVMSFTNVDDAIERANGTEYGLGGSVWTNDLEQGVDLANRLECGTAWINQHKGFLPNIPFGGAKLSGIGLQNGDWGLDELSQIQVINLAK